MLCGYQTMATELTSSADQPVTDNQLADAESRAGLTTDPDSLLAVLDTIEKSIAAGGRQKLFCKSPSRLGVFFH
jgi:hypothetical protein